MVDVAGSCMLEGVQHCIVEGLNHCAGTRISFNELVNLHTRLEVFCKFSPVIVSSVLWL